MNFHNYYIKMYMHMHVFCMASVLHHASFLKTRLAFKLRDLEVGISSQQNGILLQSFIILHYSSRPFYWWFVLKIEFVVFVYELIIYL